MSRVATPPAEPLEATARGHLSKAVRLALHASYDGLCAMCGGNLPSSWALDHLIPLELGGADQPSNWQPLCPDPCHKAKTRADIKAIAKMRRQKAKHEGTFAPSRFKIPSRPFNPTRSQKMGER